MKAAALVTAFATGTDASNNIVRLTSYMGSQLCKGEPLGTFDAEENICYQNSKVETAFDKSDQIIKCKSNGDVLISSYQSRDGSCSNKGLYDTLIRKGECYYGRLFECISKLPNIVELAESVSDLSTLVSAVVAADLVDTLSSPGPFTVFAPSNEGFAALPADTLDSLMKPESKASLIDILTYHVLPEQVLSTDLGAFQAVETVEGKTLHITVFGGVVKVGPSLSSKDLRTVVSADNLASNGVAHIIDGVLLPKSAVLV
jgi:uncharacterized surface protein with fasciclin (FAS1) repeats